MALPVLPATLAVLSVATLALGAGAVTRDRPAGGPVAAVDSRPAATVSPGPRWRWPVEPPSLLRRFAVGPYRWSAGHRGVDLAAAPGSPVTAPADGVVSWAGRVAGRGVLVLAHAAAVGGRPVRTTYEPVEAAVAVGTRVGAGTTLGRLGSQGGHCGAVACLHWGALLDQDYVDPLRFVGRRSPPVLLPLAAS